MKRVFTKQSIIDQTGFDMESLSSDIADLLIDGLNKSIAPLIEENERLKKDYDAQYEELRRTDIYYSKSVKKRKALEEENKGLKAQLQQAEDVIRGCLEAMENIDVPNHSYLPKYWDEREDTARVFLLRAERESFEKKGE